MSAADEQVSAVICAADELEPGGMVAGRLGSMPIVVIRTTDGELHALEDRCLHQGARLSRGRLLPAAEDDAVGRHRMDDAREVVKCPWHGYQYDVRTGCAVFDRRIALRRVRVVERNGLVLAFGNAD
jgi:nitrite reductase/ring-hydroxylating ferredoxin subunit